MFKQITNLNGGEIYMIFSLWMFLVFFIIVTILLLKMSKDHVSYMKGLPLQEDENKYSQSKDSELI